jgi:hypothetical protein
MADKEEIHPAVELLLARMKSHPEEFMTSEKAYQQGGSRVRKMSSMYGDILNRASEEEAALLRAAMNKIQLGVLHKDLMEELLNGDERRAKEAEEQEYERNLAASVQHMKQQQARQHLTAQQQAYDVDRDMYRSAGITHIAGQGPSLKAGITTQPTLSSSAINQIKKALKL